MVTDNNRERHIGSYSENLETSSLFDTKFHTFIINLKIKL